jgi:type I restriction enzyme S subunit
VSWRRCRLDWLTSEERGAVNPTEISADTVFHYSIPALDEIGDGRLEQPDEIGSGKLLLSGGEILISKLNPRLPRVLLAEAHDVPTLASTEFIALRPGPNVDERFLRYWLGSEPLRQMLNGATMSVTRSQQRVRPEIVTKSWLRVPSIDDQRAIADYLDRETARIDALIEKKQRVLVLLDERWTAFRRDLTGVAAPSRWDSVQLRRVARLQAGAAFPHEYQGDSTGTIAYVKVSDLVSIDGHFRLRGTVNRVTPDVAALLRSPVLPIGTIVLPKIGAALLTNRRAILSEPSCLDQNVMGVTVHEGEPAFVFHALASIDLGELSTPGPVPLLNEDAALSVRIPWPPVSRQRELVKDLNERRAAILAPSAVIQQQILLLAEHRQALITAAVTGELEVPGVAA